MALVKASADKRYFVDKHGQPFFALGVNYVGYFDRAWKMWDATLFDPDLIARDFRKAQTSGFNAIRLFIHPGLLERIQQGDFQMLDHTLSLAQDHNLYVLLTLNEAHALNLSEVSQWDAYIAQRYRDVPTILGYDLESSLDFYNLAAAIYPGNYQPLIRTVQLVDHYGVRVSRNVTAQMLRYGRLPEHLQDDDAFYYANALRLFLEYEAAVNDFVKRGQGTLIDFMLSPDAEPWYILIDVLDKTVEAWLRSRITALRQVGCQHMLTVGWNRLHFAGLPANHLLDFQQYQHYASLSTQGFQTIVDHLSGLHRVFPKHPIVLGAFGWSNQSGTSVDDSRAIEPNLTAHYEAATYAHLRARQYAGGFKWALNDIDGLDNPHAANMGVFRSGDRPKPIRYVLHHFSEKWPHTSRATQFVTRRDRRSGFAYRLDVGDVIVVGGHTYQDETLTWEADLVTHCFIQVDGDDIVVEAQDAGQLSLAPWDIVPGWNQARETDVYRVYGQQFRTKQHTFGTGQPITIDVRPGAEYMIRMGHEVLTHTPSEGALQIDPRPGEHVVLLADFDNYLSAALDYIRRFAPDFTFAPDSVAGRWIYVTVVASADHIADSVLEDMRASGAYLVERVIADSIEETKTLLDTMARQNRRFQTMTAPLPPQEEPPLPTVTTTNGTAQTYTVQPGDSLGKIAEQLYGDLGLWTLIFEANRDKLSDPGVVQVGLTLQIPAQA